MESHRILVFLVFFCSLLQAQNTTIFPFLNISSNARSSALGGNMISIRDYDLNFASLNPSLLNKEMDNQISLQYSNYIADSNLGAISFAKDLSRGHLLIIDAKYLDYGNFIKTDMFGNEVGNFKATDASIGLGYAYQFEEDWTIGGQVKLITSKIDLFTSTGIGGTMGITYHDKEGKETISILARNFGYQIKTYNGTRENFPFAVDFGYTRQLRNFPLTFSILVHDLQQLDISQETNFNEQKTGYLRKIADHFAFGVEFFPEKSFNIRVGYNVKKGNELTVLDQKNFSGLSVGFGMKISYFRFDFAHTRFHNSSNINQIGLTLDMIEMSGKRR